MPEDLLLVDFENVQQVNLSHLGANTRVVIFLGATQKWVRVELFATMLPLGERINLVKIEGTGKNALDFHIAFYIGRLSAAHPDAYFHIISKDKGFDPLINHLKEQKIFCSRWASVTEIPLVKSTTMRSPKERAADFYAKRIASAKARPATITSLQSAIHSHFHKMLSTEDVTKVIEALKAAGQVVVNGQKVTYPDPAHKHVKK